jgi:hypothetical protein
MTLIVILLDMCLTFSNLEMNKTVEGRFMHLMCSMSVHYVIHKH